MSFRVYNVKTEQFTMEEVNFDPRLQGPFTMLIVGPSSSGKSQLVLQLIDNIDSLITPKVKKITYCYSQWQNVFENYQTRVTFHEGMIGKDDITGKQNHSLLIIDDLTDEEHSASIKDLFIKDSHHTNTSVIFISQNLFLPNKDYRTISINSHYVVLFKNPREMNQIQVLGRQCFPENPTFLSKVYASETTKPHSYIVLDFKQKTPDKIRVRNSITSPMKTGVFIPHKRK